MSVNWKMFQRTNILHKTFLQTCSTWCLYFNGFLKYFKDCEFLFEITTYDNT